MNKRSVELGRKPPNLAPPEGDEKGSEKPIEPSTDAGGDAGGDHDSDGDGDGGRGEGGVVGQSPGSDQGQVRNGCDGDDGGAGDNDDETRDDSKAVEDEIESEIESDTESESELGSKVTTNIHAAALAHTSRPGVEVASTSQDDSGDGGETESDEEMFDPNGFFGVEHAPKEPPTPEKRVRSEGATDAMDAHGALEGVGPGASAAESSAAYTKARYGSCPTKSVPNPPWLDKLPGWTTIQVTRVSGNSAGTTDKYFIAPVGCSSMCVYVRVCTYTWRMYWWCAPHPLPPQN